jgi:hypothetical protein
VKQNCVAFEKLIELTVVIFLMFQVIVLVAVGFVTFDFGVDFIL